MTGTTNAGGSITVSHDEESERVLVGVKDRIPENRKRKFTTSLIPLTIKEARIMAGWLNAAADHTEANQQSGSLAVETAPQENGTTGGSPFVAALSAREGER